jgi:hypothetical protein
MLLVDSCKRQNALLLLFEEQNPEDDIITPYSLEARYRCATMNWCLNSIK